MRTFTKSQDDTQGDYVLCPAGTMAATVTVVAFLGRHPLTWQGEERIKEMIGLQYEVSETGPDGRPLSVSETMPFSTHEKARFFARLVALMGGTAPPDGFDFRSLCGRPCIITVAHVQKGERVFANVVQAGAVPRGMAGPTPSVAPIYFDILSPAESCPFDALPGRFKRMAETALGQDYQAPPRPAPTGGQAAPPSGHGYPPSAPPPGQWQGSHAAQAPGAWSPPRQPGPPPAPPAARPDFDDDIPF